MDDVTPSRPFLFPGIDDTQLKEADWENEDALAKISSKVLMKALYGTRTCRWDLLHAIITLAREAAKWNKIVTGDCTNPFAVLNRPWNILWNRSWAIPQTL